MFFIIKSNDGTYVPYNDLFKSYATINYKLGASGPLLTISQCSSTDFSNLLNTLPELKGIPANSVYCPPINVASYIQKGEI